MAERSRLAPIGHTSGKRGDFPLVRTEFLMDAISASILHWAHGGISPSEEQRARILEETDAIVGFLHAAWMPE